MPNKLSSAAIDALRSTLRQIEEQSGLMPDDSALLELKRILLSRIAELEAAKQARELGNRPTVPSALEPSSKSGDTAKKRALELAVSLVAEPNETSVGASGSEENVADHLRTRKDLKR